MSRLLRLCVALSIVVGVAAACSDDEAAVVDIPVNADGFPTEWPIAVPPGNVNDCANGHVNQDEALFSVVVCLPDEPDPFTASQDYLATLEAEGFVEREPGAFIVDQDTFLEGNGIEIYFQLLDDEATIVLIKPGG